MSLKVSRILHAGYVFQYGETQIAFDTIFENPFSRNCYAFPNVEFDLEQIKKLKLDAVFISHYHDDHCSLESLNLLDRETPIYMYCLFDEMFSLIKELGFKKIHSLKLNVPVQIGDIEVIPRRALDAEVDSIFQIKAGDVSVLNVVDSWIDDETLNRLVENGPWDLVLWPFQTMREIEVLAPSRNRQTPVEIPVEWLEQLKILNPRYVVPSSCQFQFESWSWYNQAFFPITYSYFQEQVRQILPAAEIIRLNPSASIALGRNTLEISTSLNWIRPIGTQDVDYEYQENRQVPKTSEIAKKFAPLNFTQTETIVQYCQNGLIKKYSSMEAPLDSYFEKPRLWKLSIYDHIGSVKEFYYLLNANEIKMVSPVEGPVAWTTEVPIAKFYAALELGESLTSMYMRINDQIFSPEIEKEIDSVDIVEDPLIRCLFNGVFGSYQIAQLKRIKERL